ncbi:MAG TPA: hypothetical protein H9870_04005 [Candidatus Corynebacterium avicola]|uniref:Uncharacterized protein n=1 Tax=Candidatus Corynebacterium avicola TaxID=2838527 RepID=A0A9D1RMI1_9CORY|nr:hypothetical protein [Candidatus Corynebacterium avicola]
MKARKPLITLAAATALTIASTGIASADGEENDDEDTTPPTASAATLSDEDTLDSAGSISGDDALGSFDDDGAFDLGEAGDALGEIAGGAGDIGDIADAVSAVVDASDALQGVADDAQGGDEE